MIPYKQDMIFLDVNSRMRTSDLLRLNEEFNSKFSEDNPDQEMPKKARAKKYCDINSK